MACFKSWFAGFCFLSSVSFVGAQSLLNGDFETNSGSCVYNISNATYNANMPNSTGFGVASQLDIIRSTCGYGAAQSGAWFVAMAVDISNTQNDAFSLTASAPLVAGNAYSLFWYDRGWSPYATNTLEIGLSTTATTFGTLLYTTPMPTIGTWVARSVSFNAPNNGQFITVRTVVGSYGWTHVDNFVLGIALPVRALSAYGWAQGGGVDSLYWEVDGAENVGAYQVEYLAGQSFVPIAERIPQKTQAGNFAIQSNWGQTDAYPHIYRIKITDGNGTISYSNTFEAAAPLKAQNETFQVFPNPSQGNFQLQFNDPTQKDAIGLARIYDLQGKLILETFVQSGSEIKLDDQKPGLYIVQLRLTTAIWSQKILLE